MFAIRDAFNLSSGLAGLIGLGVITGNLDGVGATSAVAIIEVNSDSPKNSSKKKEQAATRQALWDDLMKVWIICHPVSIGRNWRTPV